MRRVGILTEIFPEYHSPNKPNCRSLKFAIGCLFSLVHGGVFGLFYFLKQARAEHNVTTK